MKNNFFARVYNVVKEIPRGKVATYGQIATILGAPKYSQVVGFALHSNPEPNEIPCHRVVNRHGELSVSFAFGGENEQRKKLEKEGVIFTDGGKVDMKACQWKPYLNDIT